MRNLFNNNFEVREGIPYLVPNRSSTTLDSPTDKTNIVSGNNQLFGRSLYGAKGTSGSSRFVEERNSFLAWQQTSGAAKSENATAEQKMQLSPEETKIKDFIEENRMNVGDGLKGIVAKHKFTLVGEAHLPGLDPMRKEVASSLQELKKQGLTHVGLEIPSNEKDRLDKLDYSKSDEVLKAEIKASEMADVLIAAKRAGLEVVYLDKPKPNGISSKDYGELSDNPWYQSSRDQHMFDNLTKAMGDKDKALIYIGSLHVNKSSTEIFRDRVPVRRLGTLLSQKYGDDQVASIRNVLSNESFDQLPVSKNPSLHDVMPNHMGFIILPNKGPVKSDPRMTNADYIITGK